MEYIRGTDFEIPGFSAVTLGKFDGMHTGHQELLANMERFRKDGARLVVFTFGTSPYELLKGHTPLLMTNGERRHFCEQAGVDYLIEFPFTDEVCHMPAETFIRKVGRSPRDRRHPQAAKRRSQWGSHPSRCQKCLRER